MNDPAPPPPVDASRDDPLSSPGRCTASVAEKVTAEDSLPFDPETIHSADGGSAAAANDISPWMKVLLFSGGWLLVLIGVAGLVLPGIQGVLTIAVGLALLSVVSGSIHRWTQRGLQRWPALLKKMEKFRSKMHTRLRRKR